MWAPRSPTPCSRKPREATSDLGPLATITATETRTCNRTSQKPATIQLIRAALEPPFLQASEGQTKTFKSAQGKTANLRPRLRTPSASTSTTSKPPPAKFPSMTNLATPSKTVPESPAIVLQLKNLNLRPPGLATARGVRSLFSLKRCSRRSR